MAGNAGIADSTERQNALKESEAALVFGIAHPKTRSSVIKLEFQNFKDR